MGVDTHLKLLCPFITLLLNTLYLTFVMLCLDINLSESATEMRDDKDGHMKGDTLLYCLLHVLFGRIELLLKELDFPYQAVVGCLTAFRIR
jgi:hypothetical protein